MDGALGMGTTERMVAIVGRLGVRPMVRLSLPARRILAFLALSGGGPVPRAVAAAQLWPDFPEDVARANLRRALWNVPAGWIGSEGDDLLLNAATDLADAELAASRALEGAELQLDDIKLLSSDLLEGWNEEWAIPAQDRFRLLRVQALEMACRTMTRARHLTLAIQAGSAALAAEPLRESAAAALIDAHLAQENRYEAVRCFRSLARRLNDELGVDPQPALAERVMACAIPVGCLQ
jgi:DNA-binding SARP family transcriptional activator